MGKQTRTAIINDKRWRQIAKTAAALGGKVVKVGIVGADADVPADEDGITIGRLAGVHEFGAAIRMRNGTVIIIPERSFIRATVAANRGAYSDLAAKFSARVLDGKMTEARALGLIGAKAASDMQKRIAAGIEPANADSTIARKGSSKPLIDTGRLRQSITWAVVDKRDAD